MSKTMEEKEFLKQIKEHRGIIVKISKMYFEVQQDQEDLFQEILLQLWKSIKSFKHKSKFSTWIYKVALNTAIVYSKKRTKKRDFESEVKSIEITEHKDVRVESFYKAVRQLNKIEKALIFMYIEGLPGDEIARNLGLSPSNVRVKTNRTKNKLQEIIKANNYGL